MWVGPLLAAVLALFGQGIWAFFVMMIWTGSIVLHVKRGLLFSSHQNIEQIRRLSWSEFEEWVGEALRREGYRVEQCGGRGPDGGVDLVARRDGKTLLVQCKHWKRRDVGVNIIREMFGVMVAEKADECMVITTGNFSQAAEKFAHGKPVRLVDGVGLARMLGEQLKAKTGQSASAAKDDDSSPAPIHLPNCPNCDSPMVLRVAKRGTNAGNQFLGCSRYPTCRGTRDFPA